MLYIWHSGIVKFQQYVSIPIYRTGTNKRCLEIISRKNSKKNVENVNNEKNKLNESNPNLNIKEKENLNNDIMQCKYMNVRFKINTM